MLKILTEKLTDYTSKFTILFGKCALIELTLGTLLFLYLYLHVIKSEIVTWSIDEQWQFVILPLSLFMVKKKRKNL
jgi:hypothetical protein